MFNLIFPNEVFQSFSISIQAFCIENLLLQFNLTLILIKAQEVSFSNWTFNCYYDQNLCRGLCLEKRGLRISEQTFLTKLMIYERTHISICTTQATLTVTLNRRPMFV